MIQLPKEFDGRADQRGWHFREVMRDGRWVLYQKNKGNFETFEVVRLVQSKAGRWTLPDGKVLEYAAQERMPASERWGISGWSFPDRDRAKKAFFRLAETDGNGDSCEQGSDSRHFDAPEVSGQG